MSGSFDCICGRPADRKTGRCPHCGWSVGTPPPLPEIQLGRWRAFFRDKKTAKRAAESWRVEFGGDDWTYVVFFASQEEYKRDQDEVMQLSQHMPNWRGSSGGHPASYTPKPPRRLPIYDVGRYDRETRDLLAAVVKAAREEVRRAEQRYYDDRAKEARASIEKERRG